MTRDREKLEGRLLHEQVLNLYPLRTLVRTYYVLKHHLIAAMCSLLSLELGLKGHNDILKSCLATPTGTVTTAFLVSPSGGLHRRGIMVSTSLGSMAKAVDTAIGRLLDGYSDVLDAYVFPEQYANALKSRAA